MVEIIPLPSEVSVRVTAKASTPTIGAVLSVQDAKSIDVLQQECGNPVVEIEHLCRIRHEHKSSLSNKVGDE